MPLQMMKGSPENKIRVSEEIAKDCFDELRTVRQQVGDCENFTVALC